MAKQSRALLKTWFVTAAKPLQQQYWDWLDSFWHKDELIPINGVDGLTDFLNTLVNLPPLTGSIAAGSSTITLPAGRFYREMILIGSGIVSIGLTPGGIEKLDASEVSPVLGIPYNAFLNIRAFSLVTLYIQSENTLTYEINRS